MLCSNRQFLLTALLGIVVALVRVHGAEAQTSRLGSRNNREQDSAAVKSPLDTLRLSIRTPGIIPQPFQKQKPRLVYIKTSKDETLISRDTLGRFVVRRKLYGYDYGVPLDLSFEQFAEQSFRAQKEATWAKLVQEQNRKQQERRGLLDFKINIPGGKKSAFTTIFGKPSVNLSVNGTANMNVGATIQQTEDPSIPPAQQTQVNPTFNQNLKLNIQGTIGDKLTIATDWDTERAFDFQNRLNIFYEGYEDEIIKRIELGNVSMETGNSLVRGGGALFGIKSIAEMGPLKVSSVISQQQGESNSLSYKGGSEETQIELRPGDYEDRTHFFLDFFARQQYEEANSNPQQLQQVMNIENYNVYRFEGSTNLDAEDGVIRAIAIVELGTTQTNGGFGLPSNETDGFTDQELERFRSVEEQPPLDELDLQTGDYTEGFFRKLVEGVDYEINPILGYLSLKSRLPENQAIAIAYTHRVPGEAQPRQVGEFNRSESPTANQNTFLKLLRNINMTTNDKAWDLTMRNIYNMGVSNLTGSDLEIDINFTEGNVAQNNLPGRNTFLIQDLGLDRLNPEGARTPDNKIDISGQANVVDLVNGRIIFPYLEPFGARIDQLIDGSTLSDTEKEELKDDISFTELYDTKAENVQNISSKNNFYRIDGTSKGGVSDNYFLGIALVEGSVRVYANGTELTEGSDYNVDYSVGSITILSDQYLRAGQEITIDYESNQLLQIEQKTFTGVRAEYTVSDNINFGTTFFQLKERPLQDKIRIGDEPINNTVIGLDANASFDAPWLTRAIDKVPLLQTKEPSNISFSGEWAQLRPGVAQTNAVQDAIDDGRLFNDEENGLSFVDDFEGVENNISFMSPARWNLAAAPAAVPGLDLDASIYESTVDSVFRPSQSTEFRIARSDLRSQFSWYSIPLNIGNIAGGSSVTPESRRVQVSEVFPERQVQNQQQQNLNTLDIYYNPNERGPYNYNPQLRSLLEQQPEQTWGGMTATLPSGLQDLNQNNVEFVEFWVQSLLPDAREPNAQDIVDYDGKIYLELGVVSEDIIPNSRANSEDGLLDQQRISEDRQGRSYLADGSIIPDGEFSNENRDLEDVGLDGAPNEGGLENSDGIEQNEQTLFADFLNRMRDQYADQPARLNEILGDPSNDDYFFFGQNVLDGEPLHERFHRMYGYHDGNTPQGAGDKRAITNQPDTEGLITPSAIQNSNSYYQYEIDWNPADLDNLRIGAEGTYIVDQVRPESRNQLRRWYQVRIPLEEFTRRFGDIDNFQNISYIRLWMSGYRKPFTLRFATFELVGNQWREAEEVNASDNELPDPNVQFRISTVNIEENSTRRPVPYREPTGAIRAVNRAQQVQTLANEQSIAIGVTDLGPQDKRMIKRIYTGGLNMVNYSNLRMFVHGEGYRNRQDAELIVRLGTDLTNNYYEYRQPVTPTDTTRDIFSYLPLDQLSGSERDAESRLVWKNEENSMNIVLSVFNQIKQLRANQLGREGITTSEFLELTDLTGAEDAREILRDSPEGAMIGIIGNPSLDRVNEIGMGIRNPFNLNSSAPEGEQQLDAEFWLNELRVSGFDDQNATASNARLNIKFADFATVKTNFQQRSDGFGSIQSRLGDRQLFSETSFDINGTVNLHKFIPDRFGWNFPVGLSYRRSLRTPRFLPNQGDVRLDDFRQAVRNDSTLTEDQQTSVINEQVRQSETFSENYSINLSNISKKYSKSPILKYTLDNTTFRFVYNDQFSRSPNEIFRNSWNFDGSVNYRLQFRKVRFLQPLQFLETVPVLGAISGFRIGYLPSGFTASAGTSRSYEESNRRVFGDQEPLPLQQTHRFNYNTNFGFNFQLMPSVSTSYQNSTSFDLTNVGVEDFEETDPIDSTRFVVKPTTEVFNELLFDTLSSRRNNYSEQFTASWNPKINQVKWLGWLDYNAKYSGAFGWNNSARGANLGATVNNTLNLTQSLGLDIGDILDAIPLYSKAVKADNREQKDRAAQRLQRKKERAKAREEARNQTDRQEQEQEQPTPPNQNKSDSQQDRNSEAEESEEESSRSLLDDLTYYSRKLVLAGLSMNSIDMSYTFSTSSSIPGIQGTAPIYYMFNDPGDQSFSPNLGYRLGLRQELGREFFITNNQSNADITFPRTEGQNNNVSLNTGLTPFDNLRVDLSWNTVWNERGTDNITLTTDNQFNSVSTLTGDINTSGWSFGQGYESLFRSQLSAAFNDIQPGSSIIADSTGNQNGTTALDRRGMETDFRNAYLSTTGTVGTLNFIPIPLPNWRITWSGLEKKIPFLADLLTRASLNHNYKGTYRLGWRFNPDSGFLSGRPVGNFSLVNLRPAYEPNTITVERIFSPLIGLNLSWKSGLTTNLQFDDSQITTFSMANARISEAQSTGVKMTVSYSIRDFNLPFFKKVKNTVDLNVNASYNRDIEQPYDLVSDISNALSDVNSIADTEDLSVFTFGTLPTTGQRRIQASAIVGYQFSSTLKANFEYSFRRLIPESTRVFGRTDHDIKFNIVISIRSR